MLLWLRRAGLGCRNSLSEEQREESGKGEDGECGTQAVEPRCGVERGLGHLRARARPLECGLELGVRQKRNAAGELYGRLVLDLSRDRLILLDGGQERCRQRGDQDRPGECRTDRGAKAALLRSPPPRRPRRGHRQRDGVAPRSYRRRAPRSRAGSAPPRPSQGTTSRAVAELSAVPALDVMGVSFQQTRSADPRRARRSAGERRLTCSRGADLVSSLRDHQLVIKTNGVSWSIEPADGPEKAPALPPADPENRRSPLAPNTNGLHG